jgi:hypothetical protein
VAAVFTAEIDFHAGESILIAAPVPAAASWDFFWMASAPCDLISSPTTD